MTSFVWRKSRYSGAHGHCVEAAAGRAHVLTRDSKAPTGPALAFTRAAWKTFTRDIKESGASRADRP